MLKGLIDLFRGESQLTQAFERSQEMLEVDREMFEAAIESLRKRDDAKLAIDVYAKDQMINAYEREVRRKVFTHLVIDDAKRDLNAGLALVSIVIDIERIGDYTKNIVELALHHPQRLEGGAFEEELLKIEAAVRTMFGLLIEALPESDESKAKEVMSEHWWVARRRRSDRAAPHREGRADAARAPGVAAALYFRYLKRVSAHLMNIASSIVNPFDRIGFRGDAPPAS